VQSLGLLVGLRAGRDYKEGDIKFLEFCGAAWRASRDGGLLHLLGRGTGGHSTRKSRACCGAGNGVNARGEL
jgi:hypothetical protein